jgi:AraC family transcriptional regulator of adaptative response / DNA-3-methyladenine glycosylase II
MAPLSSTMKIELPYRAPYHWAALLGFLSMRAIPGVERVEREAYARTIELDGAVGTLTVTHAPRGDRLIATVNFPHLEARPEIRARLRRIFDLDADPAAIAARLGADPALAPLVAARPGLRVPGAWDGFEVAVRAILGQQITVAGAIRLAGKIVAMHGTPLPPGLVEPGLTHLFPRPGIIAQVNLAPLGMPGARARALSAVAAAHVVDPTLFTGGMGLAAGIARLVALPGIGEWTACYIAMRALREPDAFLTGDIGLMRALADANGKRPTKAELSARAEAWRPWRAYAALHLWTADGARRAEAAAFAAAAKAPV